MIATQERILTDNEKYGSGLLVEEAPGSTWIVVYRQGTAEGHVAFVATNRTAAEDYIRSHLSVHPRRPIDDYSIQVWAAQDAYPPPEND